MTQITIYVDDELGVKMRAAAQAAKISQSKWVSTLIREKLQNEWPPAVIALAGSWPDLPEAKEIRAPIGADVARETF